MSAARRASEPFAHRLLLSRRWLAQGGNAVASSRFTRVGLGPPAAEELEVLTRTFSGASPQKVQWRPMSGQAGSAHSPSSTASPLLSRRGLTDECHHVQALCRAPRRSAGFSHFRIEFEFSQPRWLVRNLGSQATASESGLQEQDEDQGSNPPSLSARILAAKEFQWYLVDVKGVSEVDAEFISDNYPTVGENVAAFLSSTIGEGCMEAEDLRAQVRNFISSECEGECARNGDVRPLGTHREFRTLGDMLQLDKFPPAFTGDVGLLKSMAILNSLGWSRQRLVETSEHHEKLLDWTAEQLKAQISVLESVGVKKKHIRAFVEDSSLFKANLDVRLAPMLHHLADVGIHKDVVGDLFKFNPQGLINMPIGNFKERVNYFLDLGLSSAEVERCMRMFPQLVHLRLANLTQKVQYFESLGLGREGIVKLVAKLPSIVRHSIQKNLSPKILMLRSLGVLNEDLVKIMGKYPQFFGCSMDNLQRKLAFFQENGVTGARLVKLITWHPRAFSFSVQDNLMKKLHFWFRNGFEMGSTPMVRALASCITISTSSLEARFQNLVSLGFSDAMVRDILKKQPTILCLSEKSVRIKIEYLLGAMGRPLEEVLRCPGFLLYGLETRTKPRHRVMAVLATKGPKRRCDLSLSTILQPGEKTFVKRYVTRDARCFEAYHLGSIVVDKDCGASESTVAQSPTSLDSVFEDGITDPPEESSSEQELVAAV